MNAWLDFVQGQLSAGAVPTQDYGWPSVGRYGEPVGEYYRLHEGPAVVDRFSRGSLEITGADRTSWLHNLTTNQVKTLGNGEGNYAFALNSQGRILFDLNILVRAESLWVVLDRRFLDSAKQHFAKYTVTEEVTVTDRSRDMVCIGLVGARVPRLVGELGAPCLEPWPALRWSEIDWAGTSIWAVHNDFCGPFGIELFVPAGVAAGLWRWLVDSARLIPAMPVGDDAVQIHRIETGLPWPITEINHEVLPAETGQLERAVSRDKGCYLGQEVVERMRSRNVVARRLVGLRLEGDSRPPVESALVDEAGCTVGKLTSVCYSPSRHGLIGLGYVKTAHSSAGSAVHVAWEGLSVSATVVERPFSRGGGSP